MTWLTIVALAVTVVVLGIRLGVGRLSVLGLLTFASSWAAIVISTVGDTLLGRWGDVAEYYRYASEWSVVGDASIYGSPPTVNTAQALGYFYWAVGNDSFSAGFVLSRLAALLGIFLLCGLAGESLPSRYLCLLVFLPSALVWTSIYGKDGFALLALGLSVFAHGQPAFRAAGSAAAGLMLFAVFRPELVPVAILGAGLSWMVRHRKDWRARFLAVLGVLLTYSSAMQAGPVADLWERVLETSEITVRGGSAITFPGDPGFGGLVLRSLLMPIRPLPVGGSLLQLAAFAEAIAILALTFLKLRGSGWRPSVTSRVYLSYAIAYIPAIAILSNEGLVARQRAPLSLLLILAAAASQLHPRPGSLDRATPKSAVMSGSRS